MKKKKKEKYNQARKVAQQHHHQLTCNPTGTLLAKSMHYLVTKSISTSALLNM
jgi:hypothetical protein